MYGKSKKLYIFQYEDRFKIGVSNNPAIRIHQLSCGCPGIKSVYESEYLDNPYEIEGKLHKKFGSFSIGGEWFSFVDIRLVNEIIKINGEIVDIKTIKDRNKKTMEKCGKIFEETLSYFSQMVKYKDKAEIERISNENIQIEKFTQAVNGIDVPNMYSDLIYNILFGENTQSLVARYEPERFESFRVKLNNEQNLKIDNLTRLIGNLINLYWNYEEIENFVRNL